MQHLKLNNSLNIGISLIELLISLVIIGILGSFALSFTTTWYHNYELKLVCNDIHAAIKFAKMRSILEKKPLRLCAREHDWSHGLRLLDNTSTLIYEWRWQDLKLHVAWFGFQSTNELTFSHDFSQNAVNGYFLIESKYQAPIKIMVNRMGRIKTCNSRMQNYCPG